MCQPEEHGGYGYKFHEAVRLGPVAAAFITCDEKEILAMEYRLMMQRMRESGVTPEMARKQTAQYMRELRKRYTGKAERE